MNHFAIIGNLTSDVEVKHTKQGKAVANFGIAYNEKWKDDAGQTVEHASFFRCSLFGAGAEAFAKYHRKGHKVCIEGKMIQERWQDQKTGENRAELKLKVERFTFMDNRKSEDKAQAPAPQAQGDATQADDAPPF